MDVIPTTEPTDTTILATSPTATLHCNSPIADSPPDISREHMDGANTLSAPAHINSRPKQNNNKSFLRTISALVNNPKDLRQDFRDMGLPASRMREIMNICESRGPDGHLPRMESSDSTTSAADGGRGKRVGKGKVGTGGAMEEVYEPLRLSEHEHWVLFDPLLSYPAFQSANGALGTGKTHEPPSCFATYERYIPGKTRILEFNLKTKSVRLRSTPEILLQDGTEVEYTEQGPKLVRAVVREVKPKKGEGGGRGGRAKARKVKVVRKSKEVVEDSELSELDEPRGPRTAGG